MLKAKEAEDKYIAAVHSQSHVIKLMKEISSKKYDARRNKIAARLKSIYCNKGSSESAVLAAGSVIDVIPNFVHVFISYHRISAFPLLFCTYSAERGIE